MSQNDLKYFTIFSNIISTSINQLNSTSYEEQFGQHQSFLGILIKNINLAGYLVIPEVVKTKYTGIVRKFHESTHKTGFSDVLIISDDKKEIYIEFEGEDEIGNHNHVKTQIQKYRFMFEHPDDLPRGLILICISKNKKNFDPDIFWNELMKLYNLTWKQEFLKGQDFFIMYYNYFRDNGNPYSNFKGK